MRRRYVEDTSKMRHEKTHTCEKMRRDASKIRGLFFDFVPMRCAARLVLLFVLKGLQRVRSVP